MQINFKDIAKDDRKLISGRETGRSFRTKLNGDVKFPSAGRFVIAVPDSVSIITPSVFMGLLSKELKRCKSIADVEKQFELVGASSVTEENFFDAARTCLAAVA